MGAAAAPAIIAGGAAIGSALIGSNAASSAASAQEDAAKYAAQLQMQQYQQSREDLAPWRQGGAEAVNQLRKMLGLPYYEFTPGEAPIEMAKDATGTFNAIPTGGPPVKPDWLANLTAGDYPLTPQQRAEKRAYEAAQQNFLRGGLVTPTTAPTNALAQSMAPGADSGLVAPEGGYYKLMPGGEGGPGEFTESPGYQFTLSEGNRAIQNALSAMGRNRSGAHVRAAADYAENLASTEYDNFLRRWYQSLTPYQSLAGLGMTAGSTTGALGASAAQGAGQAQIYAGDASAAGTINQANVLSGAITGGANQLLYLNALRNLPQYNQPNYSYAGNPSYSYNAPFRR